MSDKRFKMSGDKHGLLTDPHADLRERLIRLRDADFDRLPLTTAELDTLAEAVTALTPEQQQDECETCGGRGFIINPHLLGPDPTQTCPRCHGSPEQQDTGRAERREVTAEDVRNGCPYCRKRPCDSLDHAYEQAAYYADVGFNAIERVRELGEVWTCDRSIPRDVQVRALREAVERIEQRLVGLAGAESLDENELDLARRELSALRVRLSTPQTAGGEEG